MRRKAKRVTAVGDREIPSTPRDIPVFCPLFPNHRVTSVGKTVLKRIEYDEGGEQHEMIIVHPRVNAEMDEADIMAIAGGGEYYIAIHKNDGSGQLITHRKLELDGPPKFYDEDDPDDPRGGSGAGGGRPTVINVPGGEPIIIPSGIKGSDQAAYIAQQQQIRALQKQSEGGGGLIGQVIAASMQQTTAMITAMAGGGGQNGAAMLALQGQLNAANTEKAQLIAQHGEALNALRKEHSETAAMLRDQLSKAMDETRRVQLLADTAVENARLDERRKSAAEVDRLTRLLNDAESREIAQARSYAKEAAAAKQSSEIIELAKLAAPRLDQLLSKAGTGAALPPELKEAVDGVKELREVVGMFIRGGGLPAATAPSAAAPAADPAPAPPEPVSPPASAPPVATNGAKLHLPEMPG